MRDGFGREIDYLRISVTDRCNLRCRYCMPLSGIKSIPHEEVLTFEEIARIVRAARKCGFKRFRLTGGEPLVRQGITDLVRILARDVGADTLSLTTNGVLLPYLAGPLKEAGLSRVNISIDTLKENRFYELTRGGRLGDVLQGIEAALEVGLHPVKLNVVLLKGYNDDELLDFAGLTVEKPLHVRFIELMPFGEGRDFAKRHFLSAASAKKRLPELKPVEGPPSSGPARYFRLPGARGTIGFISGTTDHFCTQCNRLRLTADGYLRPCLFSDKEIDLKSALRKGITDEELAGRLAEAILRKPASQKGREADKYMNRIGG